MFNYNYLNNGAVPLTEQSNISFEVAKLLKETSYHRLLQIPFTQRKTYRSFPRYGDIGNRLALDLIPPSVAAYKLAQQSNRVFLPFTLLFDDHFIELASDSKRPFATYTLDRITKNFREYDANASVILSVEAAYSDMGNNRIPLKTFLKHCHGWVIAHPQDLKTKNEANREGKVRAALKGLNKTKESAAFYLNEDNFKKAELEMHKKVFNKRPPAHSILGWCKYITKPLALQDRSKIYKEFLSGINPNPDMSRIAISSEIKKHTKEVHAEIKFAFDNFPNPPRSER